MPEAHRVIPNNQKLSFIAASRRPASRRPAPATPPRAPRARAFLKIQTGCDHLCTFCITRIARGKAQSRPPRDIIKDAQNLHHTNAAREIILTGVDIASYNHNRIQLGALARLILNAIPSLSRLRLSSLDPAAIDPALLRLIAEEPRLQPHLHLSIQAGDSIILKRMRRRHDRQDIIRLAEKLRSIRPDIALTADLIAGFPTETETMFQRTRDIIKECRLAAAHVFPFSPHPETIAARMPQLPKTLIHERARILREDSATARLRHLKSLDRQSLPCLMETPRSGKTPCHALVETERDQAVGGIPTLRLSRDGDRLIGREA